MPGNGEEKKQEVKRGYTIVLSNGLAGGFSGQIPDEPIPERIAAMRSLYVYGNGSFQDKVDNFCRQGEYMADYTDDAPWQGNFFRFFPTYHDLNIRQLRGYFTWRTGVRQGTISRAPEAFGCIYAYELLCGIGVNGAEETYEKLKAFREAAAASGFGAGTVGSTGTFVSVLQRWIFDYCVLAGLPKELAEQEEDPVERAKDLALSTLEAPEEHTDEEILSALSFFAPEKFPQSPVFTKSDRGKHLFALIWKQMASSFSVKGRTIFSACFGERKFFPWYPLSNALYRISRPSADRIYDLHPGRGFFFRNGHWMVERYDGLSSNRTIFPTVLHESERRLRENLHVGRPLKEDPLEAWVDPYIDAALARAADEARQARLDAISFRAEDLKTIRADAAVTRESLLTEEEREAEEAEPRTGGLSGAGIEEKMAAGTDGAASINTETDHSENPGEFSSAAEPAGTAGGMPALGEDEEAVLRLLLKGQSPAEYIQSHHIFTSVLADAINEALFDALGDTAVECDGKEISLVEDYREDIEALLHT